MSSSLVRDDDLFLPKIKYPLEMASEGAGRVPETAGKVSEAFGILLYKPQSGPEREWDNRFLFSGAHSHRGAHRVYRE